MAVVRRGHRRQFPYCWGADALRRGGHPGHRTHRLVRPRFSHNTLAQLLGARRQSVTRVLGELRDRELILSHYGATVLRDPAGLRVIMGSEPLT